MKEMLPDKVKNIVAVYSPVSIQSELKKCNTHELCLKSDMPKLSVLKKETSEQKVIDLIITWILDLNEFLNLSRKMTESQIEQTAEMLLTDFHYFNIADVNLVFQNAKKGRYGALYESLDGMKIYTWFEQYAKERSEIAYQTSLLEHDKVKTKINKSRS